MFDLRRFSRGVCGLFRCLRRYLYRCLSRSLYRCLTIALLLASPALHAQDIAALAQQRLQAAGSATGLVVGIVAPGTAPQIVTVGTRAQGGAPMTADTRFEIGSITKALTGELLAALAAGGTLRLDDPVSRHVSELDGTPAGRLTLEQLATHTSGLPRIPRDLAALRSFLSAPQDPYAGYGTPQLLAYLRDWRPPAALPAPYGYSNLGYALLGLALERAAGRPYAALLGEEILAPGGATGATASAAPDDATLAQGHDERGRATPPWSLGTFAAAGAVRASATDMIALMTRAAQAQPPFVHGATAARHQFAEGEAVGLGWHRTELHGDRVVWHNGGTGGFRSMAAYSEVSGRVVVILANGIVPTEDLALHLINPAFPLRKVQQATAVAAPPGTAIAVAAVLAVTLLPLLRAALPGSRWPFAQRAWHWPKTQRSRLQVLLLIVSLAAGALLMALVLPRLGLGALLAPFVLALVVLAPLALWRNRKLPWRLGDREERTMVLGTGASLALTVALIWMFA
jgi:D-alanyl-D-alanine-carboxypeptidase/D-alanyl-D-alanine-endopeptidase